MVTVCPPTVPSPYGWPTSNYGSGSRSGSKSGKSSKGSKKSSKNSGTSSFTSGSKSSKGTCPERDETDERVVNSFFRIDFPTIDGSTLGVDAASQLLVDAYNIVIEDYNTDLRAANVEVAMIDQEEARRQLLRQNGDSGRSLGQMRPNSNTAISFVRIASEPCRRCPSQFTGGNDVSGRRQRKLSGSSKSSKGTCLLEGLPTAEEVRVVYDELVRKALIANILGVDYLEELDEVSANNKFVWQHKQGCLGIAHRLV